MAIACVSLSPSTYQAMLLHSYADMSKEARGLLVGVVNGNQFDGTCLLQVYAALPLYHKGYELAIQETERTRQRMSDTVGIKFAFLGWYHSHPNADLAPSEDDLKLQWKFQHENPLFVGLLLVLSVPVMNSTAKSTSLSVFQCGPSISDKLEINCVIQPIIDKPRAKSLYTIACMSLVAIAKTTSEHSKTSSQENASNRFLKWLDNVWIPLNQLIVNMGSSLLSISEDLRLNN